MRTLTCAEQFRALAFAQLTYRESLRDIEVCLLVQGAKLYHMGFREAVKRSTLVDANERHDWRIFADFAQVLIRQARTLYTNDVLDIDVDAMVYALDSTTIDVCLALFDWAPFRSTKTAIKWQHTDRSARTHPRVYPYFRRENARCQRARSDRLRARRLLCLRSRVCGLRASAYTASGRQLLRNAGQTWHERTARVFAARRPQHRIDLRSTDRTRWLLFSSRQSREAASHSFQRPKSPAKLSSS
jgi:hypothetical protein